jgi:threonine/homoserine/homoserine lactone efflux protein
MIREPPRGSVDRARAEALSIFAPRAPTVVTSAHAGAAFALGFALGAAPGPVQLLILSETAKRGLSGGLRVMLGANGTLFAVMVLLALGFSSLAPSSAVLDGLRVVGGGFLVYLGIDELLRLRREAGDDPPDTVTGRTLGPTARGVVSVVLNPGAWIFFATTASAVVANASADGGTSAALLAALAMTVGVSLSDLTFTVLGSGGRRLLGERGLRWVRGVLSVGLVAIGVAFVLQGLQLV